MNALQKINFSNAAAAAAADDDGTSSCPSTYSILLVQSVSRYTDIIF